MPTVMTHAAVGWGLARLGSRGQGSLPRLRCRLAAVLAALPDADVLAFPLGIPYSHPLGHRGASHSLIAAAVFGVVAWVWLRRRLAQEEEDQPGAFDLAILMLAAASHGLLDMFTGGGGLGVALWAPFSFVRQYWPVTPVPVSPIGLIHFVLNGWPVLFWELLLLWPIAGVCAVARGPWPLRRRLIAITLCLVVAGVAWGLRLQAPGSLSG